MEFLTLKLSLEENYTASSKKIVVEPGKKYEISTQIRVKKGNPYCGYFGVIAVSEDNVELTRRIRWLNDFSGKLADLSLKIKIPKLAKFLVIIYRINAEVPFKSEFHLELIPPNEISINQISQREKENYDIPENYQIEKPEELTEEQEEKFEKNLVWIFGAPRSGTSWLGTQLLSYQTEVMNEPLIGTHLGFIFFRNIEQMRTIDLFKKEDDYFFSNKYRNSWVFYFRKMILNRIFAQFNTLEKKIVIKEPNGALGSDIISECLPNSKLIFLIRDGRDVLDSRINSLKKNSWAVKNYNLRPWPLEENQKKIELETLAKIWVKRISVLMKAYSNHHPDRRLMLKYEDLLINTTNQLEKIYQFMEISISKSKIQKISKKYNFDDIPTNEKGDKKIVRIAQPGNWKKVFTEEQKKIMKKIMNKTLKELSYSVN